MAEDFQAGICGENWWSSSRSVLVAVGGLSPCSVGIGDLGSYGWPPTDDFLGIKAKSCSESNSVSDNSMLFQDTPKAQNSDSTSGGANSLLMDSGLQMMGFALSSSATSDWNQTDFLCGGGRGESNFNSNGIQTYNDQIRKDWSPTNFSASIGNDSSSINTFKQAAADHDYFLDQNRLNSINCSSTSTPTSTPTCQGLSSAGCFPLDSTLYGYPSKLLQSLYDPGPHQPQQPLFNSRSINSNSFGTNPNDLSLSSPNFPSYLKPSLPKQPQPVSASLHFTNNTPFWNASAVASTDIRQGLVSSSQTPVLASILEDENPKCQNTLALKPNGEDGQEPKKSDKNSTTDPVFKRPRIETPSPLPTFKVRKEKLGDRVTALQQLVSPFGKTDTASVLHEAIEYIKFLHDQVSVLSTPYLKNNNGTPVQPQQVSEKANPDCPKQDLRSRGLCLVPISSTFPVTNATTSDFWTPTFGGTFR